MRENCCGYLGWVTRNSRESCAQELPSKELVNSFIARHRDAEKVVIGIGTLYCAHVLFMMEDGRILRAPHFDDMCGGIGTPELLAAQETQRRQEQEEIERRMQEPDPDECPVCRHHLSECTCEIPTCLTCGGSHSTCGEY